MIYLCEKRCNFLQIRVHIKIVKRERGGWHPFLYELSFDVCKFFACRARYPIPNLVFYYMQNYTNYNRSCILAVRWYYINDLTYLIEVFFQANSSLNLLDWRIDEGKFLDRIPLELGIYGMNTVWYSKKKQIFFTNGSLDLFQLLI